MSQRVLIASFGREADLLGAAHTLLEHGLRPLDAYTPHAVHGLDEVLGWRGSRLPWAGIAYGLAGVVFMLWFQLWTSAVDWRLNVGGRPWNSSLAFLCVTFEVMVLSAGLGTVVTFLARSGLYPGRPSVPLVAGVTNDRYALVVTEADATFELERVAQWLAPYTPLALEERVLEEVG